MSEELERATRALPARSLSIAAFEQQLGGRDVLFEVLSQADTTPEIQLFLSWLGDPSYSRNSLASLCRLANLTPGDLFLAYERALQVRAKVLARIPIAEALPVVAADAMRRAVTHKVLCHDCNGRAYYFEKNKAGDMVRLTCQSCVDGWVNQEPSLEQQKLALELGELCQKGGLTIQNQNIQQENKSINLSMGSTLARLQADTAKIAFSVEATEEPPAEPPAAVLVGEHVPAD